jgi:very-short-patch-repair endonuclease
MQSKPKKWTTAYARQLRHKATIPERLSWQRLREMKKLGYHFRRQVPFRSYILDFAEHTRRVVIELDGGQHTLPRNFARDTVRDRLLESEGYLVLRYPNYAITRNLDRMSEHLLAILRERSPTRSPSVAVAHERFDLPTRGR